MAQRSSKRPEETWHHGRQISRGGADREDKTNKDGKIIERGYPPNVRKINAELLHKPFHDLAHEEDRISEIVARALFSWNTFCPHVEKREPNTWKSRRGLKRRLNAFNTLFGRDANLKCVLEVLLNNFVYTREDRDHVKRVLEYGLNCGLITFKEFDSFIDILKRVVK